MRCYAVEYKRTLRGNASACLSLDGALYINILAMKCAYPEETTLCYKFLPSDNLFSGILKPS